MKRLFSLGKSSRSSSATSSAAATPDRSQSQVPAYDAVVPKQLSGLHKTVLQGDETKLTSALRKADVNAVDKFGRTALHYACAKGWAKITERLIDAGAESSLDPDGKSCVVLASERGHEEALAVLLVKGHDIDDPWSETGDTPLHRAVLAGQLGTASLLLRSGANPNARNKARESPLHMAAASTADQANDLVETLLQFGASPDVQNASSKTPLMIAAISGSKAAVEQMLKSDAETSFTDDAGLTAAELARQNGHDAIAQLIQSHVSDDAEAPPPLPPRSAKPGSDSDPQTEESDDDEHSELSVNNTQSSFNLSSEHDLTAAAVPSSARAQNEILQTEALAGGKASSNTSLQSVASDTHSRRSSINLDTLKRDSQAIRSPSGGIMGHNDFVGAGTHLLESKLGGSYKSPHQDTEPTAAVSPDKEPSIASSHPLAHEQGVAGTSVTKQEEMSSDSEDWDLGENAEPSTASTPKVEEQQDDSLSAAVAHDSPAESPTVGSRMSGISLQGDMEFAWDDDGFGGSFGAGTSLQATPVRPDQSLQHFTSDFAEPEVTEASTPAATGAMDQVDEESSAWDSPSASSARDDAAEASGHAGSDADGESQEGVTRPDDDILDDTDSSFGMPGVDQPASGDKDMAVAQSGDTSAWRRHPAARKEGEVSPQPAAADDRLNLAKTSQNTGGKRKPLSEGAKKLDDDEVALHEEMAEREKRQSFEKEMADDDHQQDQVASASAQDHEEGRSSTPRLSGQHDSMHDVSAGVEENSVGDEVESAEADDGSDGELSLNVSSLLGDGQAQMPNSALASLQEGANADHSSGQDVEAEIAAARRRQAARQTAQSHQQQEFAESSATSQSAAPASAEQPVARVQELEEELAMLKERHMTEVAQMQAQLNDVSNELQRETTRASDATSRCEGLESENAHLQSEQARLKQSVDDLETRLKAAHDSNRELSSTQDTGQDDSITKALRQELDDTRRALQQSKARIQSLEAENADLTSKVADENSACQRLERKLSEMQAARDAAQQEKGDLEQRLHRLTEEMAGLDGKHNASLQSLQQDLEASNADLKRKVEEIDSLRRQDDDSRSRIAQSLEIELSAVKDALNQQSEKCRSLESEAQEARARALQLEGEVSRLQEARDKTQSDLEASRNEVAQLSSELEAARERTSAAQQALASQLAHGSEVETSMVDQSTLRKSHLDVTGEVATAGEHDIRSAVALSRLDRIAEAVSDMQLQQQSLQRQLEDSQLGSSRTYFNRAAETAVDEQETRSTASTPDAPRLSVGQLQRELEALATEYDSLSRRAAHDVREKAELESELRRARTQLVELEAERDTLAVQLQHAQRDSGGTHAGHSVSSLPPELATQLQDAVSLAEDYRKKTKQLQSELATVQAQHDDLKTEIEMRQAMLADQDRMNSSLQEQLQDALQRASQAADRARQVSAAEKGLRDANGRLERDVHSLRTKLDQAQQRLHHLESQTQAENHTAALEQNNDRIAELSQQLISERQSHNQTQEHLRQAEQALTRTEAQLEVAREQQARLDRENAQLREEQKQGLISQASSAASTARIEQLQQERDRLSQEVARLAAEIQMLQDKRRDNEKELESRQQALMESQQQEALLAGRVDALEQKLRGLANERDRLEAQLREQAAKLDGAITEATRAKAQADEQLTQQRAGFERQVSQLQSNNATLQRTSADATTQCEQLERELKLAKADITALRQQLADSNTTNDELREQLIEAETRLENLERVREQFQSTEEDRQQLLQLRDQQREHIDRLQHEAQSREDLVKGLEDTLRQLQHNLDGTQRELDSERARNQTLDEAVARLEQQREASDRVLADLQSRVSEAETKAEQCERDAADATASRDEMRRLWEAEVTSRNKLGAKVLDLEKQVAAWAQRAAREKNRARQASRGVDAYSLDRERKRADQYEKQLQNLRDEKSALERRLLEQTGGAGYNQHGSSELEQQLAATKEELLRQREEDDRQQRRLQQALHAKETALQAEQHANRELRSELSRMRSALETEFVPKHMVDDIKSDIEERSRQQLRQRIAEINQALETDAIVRDAVGRHEQLEKELAVDQLSRKMAEIRDELAQSRTFAGRGGRARMEKENDQTFAGGGRDMRAHAESPAGFRRQWQRQADLLRSKSAAGAPPRTTRPLRRSDVQAELTGLGL